MKKLLNRSEAPDDDVQPAKRAGRPKKEVRKSRSNVNHNTSQKRKTPKLHPRIPRHLLTGSSTDVDTSLLSKVTKRHRLSLPATRDQSITTIQTASKAPGLVLRANLAAL